MSFNSILKSTGTGPALLKVLVSLAAGVAVGLVIFSYLIGRPKLAVITITNGEITSESTPQMLEALRYARDDNRIKAVVVKLSSPGGGVSDSAELFNAMIKLRETKPVVVEVPDMAASGGYYMLLGANYVYTNPSAFIGNIGVILYMPSQSGPSESVVTSGPFKRNGGSERMYLTVLESLKNVFIKTVMAQRGERLRMGFEDIAQGRIYMGMEAVKLGLVDELGGQDDAIRKAASLAHIRNYQIVDVNRELEEQGMRLIFASKANYSLSSLAPEFPYVYYRFLEPR